MVVCLLFFRLRQAVVEAVLPDVVFLGRCFVCSLSLFSVSPHPADIPTETWRKKNQGISESGGPSGIGDVPFHRFSGAPSSLVPPRAVTLRGFPGRAMILAAGTPGRMGSAEVTL